MLGRNLYRSDNYYEYIATNLYTRVSDKNPDKSEHVAFYKKKTIKKVPLLLNT
jgi:hypothetical protein